MRLASTLLLAFAFACRYPNADTLLDGDEDGVTADVDCDDSDPDVGASITFYTDGDGDGVGVGGAATEEGCTPPDGFGVGDDDCDDADDGRFPGNAEVTGDGIDQDCSGSDAVDCFVDADHDGWGSTTTVVAPDGSCDPADGEATNDDDCGDGDANRFPGADEIVGDGVDQNCDGLDTAPCYADADGDGFGNPLAPTGTEDCTGANQVGNGGDCDDTRATVSPGAVEACDGLPSDCADWTGPTTPGAPPASEVDDDDDAFVECTFAPGVTPANWGNAEIIPVAGGGDCSDAHATVRPGAVEACDGFPSDCDDWVDATTPGAPPANEIDDDDDGFVECTFAPGITSANWGHDEAPAVTGGGDCNDVAASSGAFQYPGAEARCDGLDNDCAGGLEPDEIDDDNDTFVECTFASGVTAGTWPNDETPDVAGDRDCDDTLARTFLGAPEFCDGVDNDCDQSVADEDGRVSFERLSDGAWFNRTPTTVRQTYTLNESGTLWFCKGTYKVRGNITAGSMSLIGRYGAETTILSGASSVGAPTERIVDLETGAPGTPTLTLRGLTFVDGFSSTGNGGAVRLQKAATVTITDCVFDGNDADAGGGLYVNGGAVTITGTTFENNLADNGGAIAVNTGNVTLTDTDVTGNELLNIGGSPMTAAGGGVLFGGGGTLTITGGSFVGNSAQAVTAGNNSVATSTGGAIHFGSGTLHVTGTTFEANSVGATATAINDSLKTTANAWGGAVHVVAGAVTIDGATFQGNGTVAVTTGATTSDPNGAGGALSVSGGTVTVGQTTPTTFSANVSENLGGAIYVHAGAVTVVNSVIDGNTSDGLGGEGGGGIAIRDGSITLNNTDLTDNDATANDGGGILAVNDDDLDSATITLTNSDLSGNTAADWGGGIACHGVCAITATTSFITGNSAGEGGGVLLSRSGASLSCTNGGVTGNAATGPSNSAAVGLGGGVQLNVAGTSVASTSCDWGADGGATDNTPSDIGSNDGSTAIQREGTAATFTCTYGTNCL